MRATIVAAVAIPALLAFAFIAAAQILPPGDDIVGIYTNDFDGPTRTHYEGSGPQVTVYIVFTNITRPGIAGWELEVTQAGYGAMLLSVTYLGQAVVNFDTSPRFEVQLGVPMTEAAVPNVWPVATMLYFLLSNQPTTLSIGPIPNTSWPEDPGPGYANAENVEDLVRCRTYLGEDSGIVFGFNTDLGGDPIDHLTWGSVKGMFR